MADTSHTIGSTGIIKKLVDLGDGTYADAVALGGRALSTETVVAGAASVLGKIGRFKDWPLRAIVPDRGAFFDFLQERWALFVNSRIGWVWSENKVAETTVLKYPGAPVIPFDHDDIRVYISTTSLPRES